MNTSYREDKGIAFDLSTAATQWVVRVPKGETITVVATRFGTWSSGIITIKKSIDGVNPVALSPAVTLGPPGSSTVLAVATDKILGDFDYLHLYPSTTEASASCDLRVSTN